MHMMTKSGFEAENTVRLNVSTLEMHEQNIWGKKIWNYSQDD